MTTLMAQTVQPIAVAVIQSGGKFLVQRRAAGSHLEGTWEFPGGKIRGNETVAAAATRECKEEIGCRVRPIRELGYVAHDYGDRAVELRPVLCQIDGAQEPVAQAGSELRWVTLSQLRVLPIPAANHELMRLIERQITDRPAEFPWTCKFVSFLSALLWTIPGGILVFGQIVRPRVPGNPVDTFVPILSFYLGPFTSLIADRFFPSSQPIFLQYGWILLLCPAFYAPWLKGKGIVRTENAADFFMRLFFLIWSVAWLGMGILTLLNYA